MGGLPHSLLPQTCSNCPGVDKLRALLPLRYDFSKAAPKPLWNGALLRMLCPPDTRSPHIKVNANKNLRSNPIVDNC